MNIKEFIENALNRIQVVFPETMLFYQHTWISDTHFIKVMPENIYVSEAFADLEFDLSDKFKKYNFAGSLCFLTEDSLVELDNPSIVLEPKSKVKKNPYQTFFAVSGATVSPEVSVQKIEIVQLNSNYPTIIETGNRKTAMAA